MIDFKEIFKKLNISEGDNIIINSDIKYQHSFAQNRYRACSIFCRAKY